MLGPLIIDIPSTTLSPEDKDVLMHPQVGGVVFFAAQYQSYEQMQALIQEIKALRDPHLLLCVDQEGGRVQRFKESFTTLPAMEALGDFYDKNPQQSLALTKKVGWLMAAELLDLGMDLSFAPVLDLERDINACLRKRCFHHDPHVVTKLALAFKAGMLDAGMQAVAKHFPGHGGVVQDTHLVAAYDERSLAEISATDLLPFQALIDNKIAALMVGHVIFPHVDELPAGSSQTWIQTILRQQLGFQGLVFSDDLSMLGASQRQGQSLDITERVHDTLTGGCDMALICNDRSEAIKAVDFLSRENYHNPLLEQRVEPLYGRGSTRFVSHLTETKKGVQVQIQTLLRSKDYE